MLSFETWSRFIVKSVIERHLERLNALFKSAREKGFFHLLSVNFLTQFFAFGTVVLVAKFVNPKELGDIRILQSYAAVFIVLAGFGYTTSLLRHCANGLAKAERDYIISSSLLRTFYASLAAYGLLAVLAQSGVLVADPALVWWLLLYGLTIPLAATTNLLIVSYQALKRIREMAYSQLFLRVLSFVLIVVLTWQYALPGFVTASVLAYLIGVFSLYGKLNIRFSTGQGTLPANYNRIALYSLAGTVVTTVGQYIDIYLLDHFSADREQIGYYSLAILFVLAASQVTGAVQAIATPYFTSGARDEVWFRKRLFDVQLKTSMLSVAIALATWVLAWLLVKYFYAHGYERSLEYLAVLLGKYVLWSSYSIMGVALVGVGLVRSGFYFALIMTPVLGVLGYLMLEWYGVVGVAWAQTIVAAISFFCLTAIVRAELRRYFSSAQKAHLI